MLLGIPEEQQPRGSPQRDPRLAGKSSFSTGRSLSLDVDIEATLSDATGAMNLNKIGVPAGGPRQSSTARKPALTTDSEVEVEATDRVSGGSGLAGPGFTLDMLMKALAGNQQKVEESVDAKLDKFFARAASAINVNALVDERRGALLGTSEHVDERDEYDGKPSGSEHSHSNVSLSGDEGGRQRAPLDSTHKGASGGEMMDVDVHSHTPVTTSGAHPPGAGRVEDGLAQSPYASIDSSGFDRAKARIACTLPSCDLRRAIIEDDADLYQTSLPNRLVSAAIEGPATLPLSGSMRRAYEIVNQQLRGAQGVVPLPERYDPVEYLDLPKEARPLQKGGMIPLHPKLGFKKHDFPVEPHGTAMTWPSKTPSDPVASIGQDCQNVGAGLSFLEQSMSAILTVIGEARESGDPADLRRMFDTVDDLQDPMLRTLSRTSYHAARGHANANLHARNKCSGENFSAGTRTRSWVAPAECANIDTFREAAAAQDSALGRRNFMDNVMIRLQKEADGTISGGSREKRPADSALPARKRRRKAGTASGTSKKAPSAAQGTPKAESGNDQPSGSKASSTGNKANTSKPKYQAKPKGGKGKPMPGFGGGKESKTSL